MTDNAFLQPGKYVDSDHPAVREFARKHARGANDRERAVVEIVAARLRDISDDVSGDADREAYIAAWSQEGALTAMLNYYRASPLYPPMGDDPGAGRIRLDAAQFMVRVPTLVIWGERDGALLPGNLRGLEACVADLRVKRIPEGSHWVIHERPDEVNALIRDFVSA